MMEKNSNLARLHLLMAENQQKLGFFMRSMQYLIKCSKTLNSSLKINPKNPDLSDFNRKLLYGNKIKLDCLRL